MRLDCEAIAVLPCLEEALDYFRDVGLLQFITDKEHWNEKLLLLFYATLHIRGYNRDPKTWVLEWMSCDVHHEAKAQDIIDLTSLLTPIIYMSQVVGAMSKNCIASSKSLSPI